MLRHLTHLTLLVLVAGSVVACSGADSGESRKQLEQQRTDVRASTRTIVDAVTAALGGTLSTQSGKYDGCRGAAIDKYDSYQYRFRGRVDVTATTRPYLDQLDDALTDAGFTGGERGTRSGGTTLGVVDGKVELTLSELPAQGDYLILDVAGPCVDTPTDDSDYWLGIRADTTLDD